jgi:hypothetical protein
MVFKGGEASDRADVAWVNIARYKHPEIAGAKSIQHLIDRGRRGIDTVRRM